MKIVLVEWNDASSGEGWESRGHKEHTGEIVSMGILVREDEDEIELIPNINIAHKLHQIAIPKGAIKRIRRLKL